MDRPPPSTPRSLPCFMKGCVALAGVLAIACSGLQALHTSTMVFEVWSSGKSLAATYPAAFILTVVAAAWVSAITMIRILWMTFARSAKARVSPGSMLVVIGCGVSTIFTILSTIMPAIIAAWFK